MVDAGLAVIVRSPAVDGTVFVDGEGVICTGADVDDALAQAKCCRDESALGKAGVDTAAQLALIAESPGEDAAFVIEGESMVASSDDLCDVLQAGDESGSILDCRVR